MGTVAYKCILCSKECSQAWEAPAAWNWQARSGPRVRCPSCGAACYPLPWRQAALAACHEDNRLNIRVLEQMWSACPNVARCEGHGHYAGDCEEPLPTRPKCLAALYSDLESAEKRLDALASKEPARLASRSAG